MDDLDQFKYLSSGFKNHLRDARRFRHDGSQRTNIRPVIFTGAPSSIDLNVVNKTKPGVGTVVKWPDSLQPIVGPLEIQTLLQNNVDTVPDRLWYKFPTPINVLDLELNLPGGAYQEKSSVRARVIRGEITSGSMVYPPQDQEGGTMLGGYFVLQDWDTETLIQANAPDTSYWIVGGFANDAGNTGFGSSGAGTVFLPPTIGGVVTPANFEDYHQIVFQSAIGASLLTPFGGISSSTTTTITVDPPALPINGYAGGSLMVNADPLQTYRIMSNTIDTITTELMPSAPSGYIIVFPIIYGFFIYMASSVSFGTTTMDGFQNFKLQEYLEL